MLGISSHIDPDDDPEDLEHIEALAAMIGSGSLGHLQSLTLCCSKKFKVLFIRMLVSSMNTYGYGYNFS